MAGDLKQPFTGRHLVNVTLTGQGSEKNTHHHEIGIESPVTPYLPGDALGVQPKNPEALVHLILDCVDGSPDDVVPTPAGEMPICRALTDVFNLLTPSRRLFELLVARGASDIAPLMEKGNAEQLKHYLSGWNEAHDVLDVLDTHRDTRLTTRELAESLRKTLPRLYSIASSIKAHPGEVHLLVVSVQYSIRGRVREGVCSTWLGKRWDVGTTAELYLQNQQKHFSMPASPHVPMIMVGPGTGLAPFRAFIEERVATGASGLSWLFFGEQRRASDFFYEDQLTKYAKDGQLRLDVAFSRDQAEKVYVQHRMREHGRDVWAWLENGAEFFVCGDKDRMAADVDRELHQIVERHGGKTPEQAHEYVETLRQSKRYKRDVY
jgi:sulfite reductase (NADPH) flavoprotein alpha-component